jgi:hypothetical protein
MHTAKDIKYKNMERMIKTITDRFSLMFDNVEKSDKSFSPFEKENLYNWLYVQLAKDALMKWMSLQQYQIVMQHLDSVYNSYVEKLHDKN